MKLFGLFVTSLAATSTDSDRLYSNEVSFWSNLPADDGWWNQDGIPEKRAKQIRRETDVYFSTFVAPLQTTTRAQKVGAIMKRHLLKTLQMSEFQAATKKCQNSRRRRSAEDDSDFGERGFNIDTKNNFSAMKDLFLEYARWARNELQPNCPEQSMRMLKRLDRLRRIWFWHTCDKGIDSSGQQCKYYNTIDHPRHNESKYNRETNVIMEVDGCRGDAELICPHGGALKVLFARYGRKGNEACKQGRQGNLNKCWKKKATITDEVVAACDGKDACSFSWSDDSLCPNVDKYTRVKYQCIQD